jgi:hypothetical protein
MSVRLTLSVDRFEGQGHSVAVLLTDEGETVQMPRSLLSPGVRPGDVLNFAIERDAGAARRLSAGTAQVQDQISRSDPGGDIRL